MRDSTMLSTFRYYASFCAVTNQLCGIPGIVMGKTG
jgi:hypothetical protein